MKKANNVQQSITKIVEVNVNNGNNNNPSNASAKELIQINNLKEILGQTSKKGERLILLNKLSEKLLLVAPEEVLKYASQALMMGQIVNAKQQIIKSNLILGAYYNKIEDNESALSHFQNALLVSLELEDNVSSSNCYLEVGHANRKLGQTKAAISNYQSALKLYKELKNNAVVLDIIIILGELSEEIDDLLNAQLYFKLAISKQKEFNIDKSKQANIFNKLGCIYLLTEQYQEAEPVFLEALAINKVVENHLEVSKNSTNLGQVYLNLKQYDQAINFFNIALKSSIADANSIGMASTLKSIGVVYHALEMYDACIRNYNEALVIFKELDDQQEISTLLEVLGKINFQIRNYQKAVSFFKQTLDLGALLMDDRLIVNSHFYLGKVSLKKQNPETAISHFEECIQKAEAANLQSDFIEVYQEISNCYAEMNQYKEAFNMQKKFNVLLEFKLTNSEKTEVQKLKDTTNVSLEKNKQLQTQNVELKRFISSAIQELRPPIRVIASFTEILMKAESNENNDEFLGIVNRSSKRVQSFLKDVYTFSRIIDKSNLPTINISLNNVLKNVLNNLGINHHTQPKVTLLESELPTVNAEPDEMALVLESILMNSLKHNAGRAIEIKIFFEEKEDQLIISVEDNGIGVDKEFQDLVFYLFTRVSSKEKKSCEGTGIGLSMAKKVLNNRKHDIWMETPETGAGTRVSFSVSKPQFPS